MMTDTQQCQICQTWDAGSAADFIVDASTFGPLVQQIAAGLRSMDERRAERVYLMAQGEHALHFHALVMARDHDLDPAWRGPALLGHAPDLADRAEAQRVAGRLRALLARW